MPEYKPKWTRYFRLFRQPDVILGRPEDPYMLRWWVIPRNPFLNIYLHKFMRSDDDRALHDHPWASMSFLLTGSYLEEVPADPEKWVYEGDRRTVKHLRKKWRPYFRGCEAIHRVELLPVIEKTWKLESGRPDVRVPVENVVGAKPVWTIFVTGPRRRSWGFWCPFGWRSWREFLDDHEPGGDHSIVGKGCE